MELEELKRIRAIDARTVLKRAVDPLGTEYDVALHELIQARTLRLTERVVELPGLTRATPLILQVLSEFKEKEKRNIMPLQYAKTDDIVIMALRPEHIAANFTYERDVALATGEFVGDFNILPTAAGVYSVPDRQVIVATDVVELASPAGLTAVRIADIDGIPQYAVDATLQSKATDLRIFEFPHPAIADATIDIDGKLASKTSGATVTTYAFPCGVWIGLGKDVPGLTKV